MIKVFLKSIQIVMHRYDRLSFPSHADYVIAEETADSADAARRMVLDLAPAAATNAINEFKLLQEAAGEQPVTAADWPYWENTIKTRFFLARVSFGITAHPGLQCGSQCRDGFESARCQRACR